MRKVIVRRPGSARVLEVENAPDPTPQSDEVCVDGQCQPDECSGACGASEVCQVNREGGFACGVVRRVDGGTVTAFALNPPFEFQAGEDRRVPDMLAALNEELAAARGWDRAPESGAPDDPHGVPAV